MSLPVDVPGLTHLRSYLSDEEHDRLQQLAAAQKPSRPAYMCGSAYEHVCLTCPKIPSLEMYVLLRSVCDRMQRDALLPHMPGTLTINWYEPHEGLRPHIDNPEVIAELVVSISLGSACVMDFVCARDESLRRAVLLEPGDVVIQTGEVRYEWTHGIRPEATHVVPGGRVIERGARVSVQLSDFDPRIFSSDAVQKRRLDGALPEHPGGITAAGSSIGDVAATGQRAHVS